MADFDKRIFFCDKKMALWSNNNFFGIRRRYKYVDFFKNTQENSDKKLISLMFKGRHFVTDDFRNFYKSSQTLFLKEINDADIYKRK